MVAKVERHTHNGADSPQIEYTDLSILPEDHIPAPTGGPIVDIQARKAINLILKALKNKRLVN